jgi:Dolichyl-phosphate-mannose-protein mannosyltransferase
LSKKYLSAELLTAQTAGIYPEKFSDDLFFSRNRKVLIGLLVVLMIVGFGLRVWQLGSESLSEDELNKLQTVEDYRKNGLSGRNGEHPFLMKGLQTASITIVEKVNESLDETRRISEGAALRFPTALIGTLTILALFLLFSELFGSSIGVIVAGLWAVDPIATGFDRIAKEDSFLLFFFLLANYFWLRGQSRAERSESNWLKYAWLAATALGAMVASKYLPHLLAVTAAYYFIFQSIPATKWRMGKIRWLTFFAITGFAFILFNPTILIPETWREMLKFGGEKRIGHDSYEFFGELYRNQATAWLKGVPWTFYYLFILVKTPLLTLIFFLIGLPLLFKKKLGDGRYFVFFWAFMWFMPFSVLGGKFTRYFTLAEPLILLSAAVCFYFILRWLSRRFADSFGSKSALVAVQIALFVALLLPSFISSYSISPHFRLHTNIIGGGTGRAGSYFPHDEFYDTSTREIVQEIAAKAKPNTVVANETPGLFEHYAKKAGREDLVFVSLSDNEKVEALKSGDFIVAVRGRRYFSNDRYLEFLNSIVPIAETKAGEIPSARIYQLDENSVARIQILAKQ